MYSTVYELDSWTLWKTYVFSASGAGALLFPFAISLGCVVYALGRRRPFYLVGVDRGAKTSELRGPAAGHKAIVGLRRVRAVVSPAPERHISRRHDPTDEPAFLALGCGVTVHVGPRGERARYRLSDHGGVARFIERLRQAM